MDKVGGNSWITTFTGTRVFPHDPDPDTIHVHDIAHSLSLICRWGGHALEFYSVAEHSVRVGELCFSLALANGMSPKKARIAALLGLVHDATEAYVGDCVRPLKEVTRIETPRGLETFREMEDHLYGKIEEGLRLPKLTPEYKKIIKQADDILLVTEARDIQHGADWDYWEPPEPMPDVIQTMTHKEAKQAFLDAYTYYWYSTQADLFD